MNNKHQFHLFFIFLQDYTEMASFKKETTSPQNEDVLNNHDSSVAIRNSRSGPSCVKSIEQELRQASTTVADVCSKGRLSIT